MDKNEAYHINVFCDHEGKIHYSSEEFSSDHSSLSTLIQVVEDAYRFAAHEDWYYVCTLCADPHMSGVVRDELDSLKQARFILEACGGYVKHYKANMLIDEAEALLAGEG